MAIKSEQMVRDELSALRICADDLSATFREARDSGKKSEMEVFRHLFQIVDHRITTLEWVLDESDVKSFAR